MLKTLKKPGEALQKAWEAYKKNHPHAYARTAAEALHTSEAALIACMVGRNSTRLSGNFSSLIEGLGQAGKVMALTRNHDAVHETIGVYSGFGGHKTHGLVLGDGIDLRLFWRHWQHGFAVEDKLKNGRQRHSFQFFDAEGHAVHKVFTRPETDKAVWNGLIDRFASPDFSQDFIPAPAPEPVSSKPDESIDREGLRKAWMSLKDVHDFIKILRNFEVDRTQAFRLVGKDFAYPVSVNSAELLLERSVFKNVPLMCFVGNHGCIQIYTGIPKSLKRARGFFNVLDPDFQLHLRENCAHSAWVVRKPTVDGDVFSLEIFDRQNTQIVSFFGSREEGRAQRQNWRDLITSLPRRV